MPRWIESGDLVLFEAKFAHHKGFEELAGHYGLVAGIYSIREEQGEHYNYVSTYDYVVIFGTTVYHIEERYLKKV